MRVNVRNKGTEKWKDGARQANGNCYFAPKLSEENRGIQFRRQGASGGIKKGFDEGLTKGSALGLYLAGQEEFVSSSIIKRIVDMPPGPD